MQPGKVDVEMKKHQIHQQHVKIFKFVQASKLNDSMVNHEKQLPLGTTND